MGAMKKTQTPGRPPKGMNGPNDKGGGTKVYKPTMPKPKKTGMK